MPADTSLSPCRQKWHHLYSFTSHACYQIARTLAAWIWKGANAICYFCEYKIPAGSLSTKIWPVFDSYCQTKICNLTITQKSVYRSNLTRHYLLIFFSIATLIAHSNIMFNDPCTCREQFLLVVITVGNWQAPHSICKANASPHHSNF